jgi:hypothetical protein
VKGGASETDFNKDKYECMLGLQQRPLGVTNQQMFEACMGARGSGKGAVSVRCRLRITVIFPTSWIRGLAL